MKGAHALRSKDRTRAAEITHFQLDLLCVDSDFSYFYAVYLVLRKKVMQ